MKKVFLKPGSAEFADTGSVTALAGCCEMYGCVEKAEHKAPKDRALSEYYSFCLDHIKEYNKAWNFFEGMSNSEVEEHTINSFYGDRPTWRSDTNDATEDILRRRAWQTYRGDDRKEQGKDGNGHSNGYNETHVNRNTPEYEAMAIMGLEPPLKLEGLKSRYKELAKKHHPDRNGGCAKSEELLKYINMAYTILKVAYEHFETLPNRS